MANDMMSCGCVSSSPSERQHLTEVVPQVSVCFSLEESQVGGGVHDQADHTIDQIITDSEIDMLCILGVVFAATMHAILYQELIRSSRSVDSTGFLDQIGWGVLVELFHNHSRGAANRLVIVNRNR
jgi:hypothetical protein